MGVIMCTPLGAFLNLYNRKCVTLRTSIAQKIAKEGYINVIKHDGNLKTRELNVI